MQISVKALSITFAIMWGGAMLLVGLAQLIWPPYGAGFLQTMASVYPGYTAAPALGQVIVGTVYGVIDAAIIGFLAGWIYNRLASS